jgi:hypothetical protein
MEFAGVTLNGHAVNPFLNRLYFSPTKTGITDAH